MRRGQGRGRLRAPLEPVAEVYGDDTLRLGDVARAVAQVTTLPRVVESDRFGDAEDGAPMSIQLLNSFQLRAGDADLVLPGGSQRLLARVALAKGAVQRPALAGTLWPEASERHAFGNLRSALSRLGGAGRQALCVGTVAIQLAPSVMVDLCTARSLALRLLAPTAPDEADLNPASIAALSSELLPGWYDDWVLLEGEDWRQLRLHALEALAGHLVRAGRYGEAIVAARASVRAEPLRETAHVTLIRVHLAEGNRCEARRQLDRLRAILHTELGLEPSPHVVELVGAVGAT